MAASDFKTINADVDCLALLARYGVFVRRLRSCVRCPLPSHDDRTPSFCVYVDGFKCFGCNRHGDWITFVMFMENCSAAHAVEIITDGRIGSTRRLPRPAPERQSPAESDNVEQLYAESAPLPSDVHELMRIKRGFSDEIIERFGLRWLPDSHGHYLRGRVIIPVRVNGRLVKVSGRRIDGTEERKYMHSRGPIETLFNQDIMLQSIPFVLICEGQFDCMAAMQMGFNAVSIFGSCSFKADWAKLFDRVGIIILALHADEAGQQGSDAISRLLPRARRLFLPVTREGKKIDVNDLLIANPRFFAELVWQLI